MKWRYRTVVLAMVMLLSGCKVDLYSGLSEVDANQMLSLLVSSQIDAVKVVDKSGGLLLRVEKKDFVSAVEILRQNGFPRHTWRSVDDLFPSGQLVTSPVQEQAKIRFLREQSLERMLGNIEGVIDVNVVIAGASAEEERESSAGQASASVLVKYSPEVNLKAFSAQLKNLIRNGLPGVNPENISLIMQPVNYRVASPGVFASASLPDSKATQANSASAAAGASENGEVRTSGNRSLTQKVKQIALSAWSLLAFWLVGCAVVVWHGLHRHRKGKEKHGSGE
ncbi:type III secretion inner membrane ring lipoprotein SctJ [Enterobacteriaceae bacterium H20N1]|uniref:Lipoprotein n=1 Tax=Dryocola boscaweniae TaxID=2925397 RepID=A0A9X3A9K4_9ENTR|nr:type III secretion inner membrane ring lipoprotein SctJ [Dryocola boscaweniae]MCT4700519.1 type III secretion inner membrane ring lipoprotein SctJ [Dryocola boscaweniae]MCT4717675.1 type III secretion inner membrane ring lipoprotein SctJ [Dryocola boscaweniae]